MDPGQLRSETIERINAECDDLGERRETFLNEIADGLCDMEQCSGFNPCHFDGTVSGNRKVEIDGYYFGGTEDADGRLSDQDIEGTLSIFCCKYTGTENPETLTKSEIEKIVNRAKLFVKLAFDGSIFDYLEEGTPAWVMATTFYTIRSKIQRFRFYVVTDGVLSERATGLDLEYIDDKHTHLMVWDWNHYSSEMEMLRGNQDFIIELENYGYDGISCIRANEISRGAEYDAYLCVMPGQLLADIYAKYGSQLMEANVRSFLSTRVKVNRNIKKTIREEPDKFFAYNNGICAVASGVEVAETDAGLKIKSMVSMQIVNGGQTTVSIFNALVSKMDLSELFVPMKLCILSPDSSEEFSRHISEYSNSQNKVGKSDFFSNAEVHVKLAKISRRVSAPAVAGALRNTKWYYERARGSYSQETLGKSKAETREFEREFPKNQVITKTDLARYRNTIELRPYDVSKAPDANFAKFGEEAQKLWDSTDVKGSAFNDRYWKETVAVQIVYDSLWKALKDKNRCPWCLSGEAKCLTAYSISKLEHTLNNTGYTLNLDAIWNEQRAPEPLMEQLLSIAYRIRGIIDEANNGTRTLYDFCKSKAAWDVVYPAEIELDARINPWVVSKRRESTQGRLARRAEREAAAMNDRIWVVGKSDEYWAQVGEWGADHGLLNADDRYLLYVASRMNSTGKPPSEAQCKKIRKIHETLEANGMELRAQIRPRGRSAASSADTTRDTAPSRSFFISHSHTTTTFHPCDSSDSVFLRSLSTFLSNFSSQKSRLWTGAGRLHRGHLCQKHPLTKTATFLPG